MFSPTDTVTFQRNEVAGSFDGIDYSSPGSGPTGLITITRNLFHDFVDNQSGSSIFGVFVTQTGGSSSITDNTMNNAGFAILVDVARPVTIQHNILSNGLDGVAPSLVSSSMPTTISENSIFGNANLGIDLGSNGVTLNDTGDADTGPNDLQNFPVLTSVTNGGGMTTINGRLNSAANTTYRIEFFGNTSIDPTGFGGIRHSAQFGSWGLHRDCAWEK